MSEKKNRPTPKRKIAEAQRTVSSLSPAATKEEKKRARERARTARLHQREAYMRGEESAMPPRDRGPARRFVRNFVDAHRTISEYLIPATFIVLILSIAPSPLIPSLGISYTSAVGLSIMYILIAATAIEALLLNRRIKRATLAKFPGTNTKGLGLYAWMRATQLRRTRMPKPQVKPGDPNY